MHRSVWKTFAALLLCTGACSVKEGGSSDTDDNAGPVMMMEGAGTSGGSVAGNGEPNDQGSGAPMSNNGNGGSAAPEPTGEAGSSGSEAGSTGEPPPEVVEMLDPDTDWTALKVIFPVMYSAYDGEHIFQVPARLDGATAELTDWQAIPSTAATFDADPEGGGVLITVQEAVPEITIAVSTNGLGGTAPLYVMEATPEEWVIGEARYNNGIEYEMPNINLIDLFDPNYVPPETPDNLACNNCHTTGAKYLEIQHTPSQIGYISADNLETILTLGMKPEGISYSVLPAELEYLYAEFHTWQATPEEIKGLIVYLRSLTPVMQGEIMIPDTVILPEMMP